MTKAAAEGMMVVLAPLGEDATELTVAEGSTVAEVIREAQERTGADYAGKSLYVDGIPAEDSDVLENGDVLSIVISSPKGGRR